MNCNAIKFIYQYRCKTNYLFMIKENIAGMQILLREVIFLRFLLLSILLNKLIIHIDKLYIKSNI
uniref:Uncharacterized protein n=1 Tax=Clostridium perfringens TaxID=1502 RepID=A0A411AMK5_CLOPF|nr:hypothetical protein pCPNY83906550-1_00048 [Clostridium perfringens]